MQVKRTGKYNSVSSYMLDLSGDIGEQLQYLLDSPVSEGSYIRIMPNAYVDNGSVIGIAMTVTDKVLPCLCGSDIGCGIRVTKLCDQNINLDQLDSKLKEMSLSETDVKDSTQAVAGSTATSLSKYLRCISEVDMNKAIQDMGTLGGGSHFIEVDRCEEDGSLYLLIHTGSRTVGKQVTEYYRRRAVLQQLAGKDKHVQKYVDQDRQADLSQILTEYVEANPQEAKLAPLTGNLFDDYLYDSSLMVAYASLNRIAIRDEIAGITGVTDTFDTMHNYISMSSPFNGEKIMRRGAVSAEDREKFILPLNMRDGSLICRGKGNVEWLYSAPHGTGRFLSREEACKTLLESEFKKDLKEAGVYTTTATVDESPEVYEDSSDMEALIIPTAHVVAHLKPIYIYRLEDE